MRTLTPFKEIKVQESKIIVFCTLFTYLRVYSHLPGGAQYLFVHPGVLVIQSYVALLLWIFHGLREMLPD